MLISSFLQTPNLEPNRFHINNALLLIRTCCYYRPHALTMNFSFLFIFLFPSAPLLSGRMIRPAATKC